MSVPFHLKAPDLGIFTLDARGTRKRQLFRKFASIFKFLLWPQYDTLYSNSKGECAQCNFDSRNPTLTVHKPLESTQITSDIQQVIFAAVPAEHFRKRKEILVTSRLDFSNGQFWWAANYCLKPASVFRIFFNVYKRKKLPGFCRKICRNTR